MEVDLVAAGLQRQVQLGVAATVADVPLARGDDLERLLAALVEVGLALGLLRLALEVTGGAQRLDDDLAGGVHGLAGHLREDLRPLRAPGSGDPLRGLAEDTTGAGDDRAGRQLQLAPPDDVGEVTEGAAHRDARALSISAAGWATTGTSTPKIGEVTLEPKRPW